MTSSSGAPTPDHGWREGDTAWRTTPRPRGWKKIKAHVHRRDGWRCTWTLDDGTRCPYRSTDGRGLECDHIGDPDDHDEDNLRTLCPDHHRRRTGQQAAAARKPRPPRNRPRQPHPGLIPPGG